MGLTQIKRSVKKEGDGRGVSGARWEEMVVDEYFLEAFLAAISEIVLFLQDR